MLTEEEQKARKKIHGELTAQLKVLLPIVLEKTGFVSVHSLNAKIGGKYGHYLDVRNAVVNSPEHFITLWLEAFKDIVDNFKSVGQASRTEVETFELLKAHKEFQDYLYIFLKRTYIKYVDSLSKRKPPTNDSEMWIGQKNANYGILVTPGFRNGNWENDKSEIRHFKPRYWSIGHVLQTGLCIPGKLSKITFSSVDQYLTFFKDVIVRNSGSPYEYQIAERYCDFVKASSNPREIALLIPEFRYEGIDVQHIYRLDFTNIESKDLNKIGFELSPWSSHGYLSKTNQMTQAQINEIAKDNFEREMRKHKDFFKKHGIFTLIYTDKDLTDIDGIFNDMKKYLEPASVGTQIKFYIYNDFFNR